MATHNKPQTKITGKQSGNTAPNMVNGGKQRNPQQSTQHIHFTMIQPVLCSLKIVPETTECARSRDPVPFRQHCGQRDRARSHYILDEFAVQIAGHHLLIDAVHSMHSHGAVLEIEQISQGLLGKLVDGMVNDFKALVQSLQDQF